MPLLSEYVPVGPSSARRRVEMLKRGGSIGAYATDDAAPKIPLWLMVFKNCARA
jgi:hypothetical protein